MLWNKIKNNKYLDKKGWLKWDKLMKDDMEDVYQQMTKKSVEPPQGRWMGFSTTAPLVKPSQVNIMTLLPSMTQSPTPEEEQEAGLKNMALNIENYVNSDMLDMCSAEKVK